MEEKINFYETSLIPYLKNKYAEIFLINSELEANLIFNQSKIAQLQQKINSYEWELSQLKKTKKKTKVD